MDRKKITVTITELDLATAAKLENLLNKEAARRTEEGHPDEYHLEMSKVQMMDASAIHALGRFVVQLLGQDRVPKITLHGLSDRLRRTMGIYLRAVDYPHLYLN